MYDMRKSIQFLFVLFAVFSWSVSDGLAQTKAERGMQRLSFEIVSAQQTSKASPQAASFEVVVQESEVFVAPSSMNDSTLPIHGMIKNNSGQELVLGFKRYQQIPKLWATSVCFGANCYAEEANAEVATNAPWAVGEHRELILNVMVPVSGQDSAVVDLVIYAPELGDSVRLLYKIRALPLEPIECRTWKFSHPYSKRVKVNGVSVSNTADFDVTAITDLSYKIFPGKGIDVQLCHKNLDGQSHTTDVIFESDSGTFTHTITLQAPNQGSVAPVALVSGLRMIGVSPNPASHSGSLTVSMESDVQRDVSFVIADLLGREYSNAAMVLSAGFNKPKLDVSSLPAGSYMLLVREGSSVAAQASFNIAK
jgi:hypothetical protein